jgi:microsomal dipeptidase-like Zn-dependent dipeptidase
MWEARVLACALLAALPVCIGASPAGAREPAAGPRLTATAQLANRCAVLSIEQRSVAASRDGYSLVRGTRGTAHIFLKPTGLGTYMLYDQGERLMSLEAPADITRGQTPGPAAEWSIKAARGGTFVIRSTTGAGRWLGTSGHSAALAIVDAPRRAGFAIAPARGCHPYPEAALGATGKTFKGERRDGTVLGYADPHMHVTADLRGGGLVISGQTFNRFGITEALGHDADVHGPDGSLDITGNLLRSGSPAGTHDTQGWPSFAGWPTYDTNTHQQVYWRWLERAWMSGMRLLGAQIVEDEPLCNIEPRKSHSCDETATIELAVRELHALQDYIDAQYGGRGRGFLRLVNDPRAARRVIERGKLAVIVGVESSNPFGCSERSGQSQCTRADIDRGIDLLHGLGVRTIFPAHWVDNALAGAALEGGDKGSFITAMNVSYTGGPFQTGPCPHPGQGEEVPLQGRQCNSRGLSDLGDYAIRRLMDKHMLIEADHLSEWARQQVLAIAEERHYPLVSSHTDTGGLWTPDELRRLYGVGGFAVARVDEAAALPDKILGFRRYRSVNRTFGVGMGTDTGGFNSLPGPQPGQLSYPFRPYRGHVLFSRQRTGTRTYDVNTDGVAHYGLLPDLLAAVQRQPHGREAMGLLFHSAEAYIEMWDRAGA